MTDHHEPAHLPYSQALEALEPQQILGLLTDDIVIRVAVHDDPLLGKPVAQFLFSVLQQELGPVTVIGEHVDGDTAVILFDTSIGDITAHGLNVVHHNASGEIDELTVFFRPLQALAKIADIVGSHMQREFGPRPDDS